MVVIGWRVAVTIVALPGHVHKRILASLFVTLCVRKIVAQAPRRMWDPASTVRK